MAAISGVDDRHAGLGRGDERRALLGVAHGDDVGVTADRTHGVGHALTLGSRRTGRLRKPQHLPAQFVHSRLKAQPRAGRGLEKQGRQFFAVAAFSVGSRMRDDVVGDIGQILDFRGRQIQNID